MFASFKQSFRDDLLGKKRSSSEPGHGDYDEEREFYRERHRPSRRRPASHAHETPDDARRRSLYRDLARKLHPDLNPSLSSHERDLWHEVRAAYEARDLEALETLS